MCPTPKKAMSPLQQKNTIQPEKKRMRMSELWGGWMKSRRETIVMVKKDLEMNRKSNAKKCLNGGKRHQTPWIWSCHCHVIQQCIQWSCGRFDPLFVWLGTSCAQDRHLSEWCYHLFILCAQIHSFCECPSQPSMFFYFWSQFLIFPSFKLWTFFFFFLRRGQYSLIWSECHGVYYQPTIILCVHPSRYLHLLF